MLELRVLEQADVGQLETLLVLHRDTSMFMRSNAHKAGLSYAGQYLQATYVGGFRAGTLVGVAALCWNGMLLVQAPEQLEPIVQEALALGRRPIRGLAGPAAQVREARRVLGLDAAPASLAEDEDLFVLDLARWSPPPRLARAADVTCRAPLPSERDLLHAWRYAFEVESLNHAPHDAAARAQADAWIDAGIADGVAWVAIREGQPVSFVAFNAHLPDIVQLGGVYTPPELRGRGYARAAVAHSVQLAQQRGATRAVLFTKNPIAARSYEAVGFQRAGDFGLVLFA